MRPQPPAAPPLSAPPTVAGLRAVGVAGLDLGSRGAVLWLLFTGLLLCAGWAGRAVLAPGPWLETDRALYLTLNGIQLWPLTALLLAGLNDPGPDYFAVIVVLLASCAWRRRAALPAAAVAIAVALALGQTATKEVEHAGARPRPFLQVAEARTPIMSCHGPQLIAIRGRDGPTATCDGSPATLVGLDWRGVWARFPSFPSGHMRETAALCALLVAFWPRSWPLALAFVVVMAFSRVHLGAHYPSDVLGGTLIGLWVGALTVLGLDLARRLAGYLHRVPPLGAAWDWVALTRVPGRPDLDPWPARVLRTGALVVAVLAALYGLGFVATTPRAGQVYNVLQNVDYFAHGQLTARFDPAVAPALYLVLGPAGLLYAALLAVVLSLAGRAGWAAGRFDLLTGQRRRTVGAALGAALVGSVVLAAAVALALGLRWAGATWFPRPPPFVQLEYTPIPPQWQAAWVSWPARAAPASFPNLHALLVAALGGVLGAHRRLALPAHLVALAAALTAVYFGAAWATDALAGYALGALAAAVALYAARQLAPQPGVTAQVSPAPAPGATTQPAGARPALNAAELES